MPAARWINQLRAEMLPKGKTMRNLNLYLELDKTFDQQQVFTVYDTETVTDGYALLNAGASAGFMSGEKLLFNVYFTAANLTDLAYQTHLSRLKYTALNPVTNRQGVFNMGRNFVVKIHVPIGR